MKNFKKSLALLLVALLLVPIFTACSSYDENYAIYELWVAGVKVTTRNQADILGDGTVSFVGDGTSGTLTLNGANIIESSDPNAVVEKIKDALKDIAVSYIAYEYKLEGYSYLEISHILKISAQVIFFF